MRPALLLCVVHPGVKRSDCIDIFSLTLKPFLSQEQQLLSSTPNIVANCDLLILLIIGCNHDLEAMTDECGYDLGFDWCPACGGLSER